MEREFPELGSKEEDAMAAPPVGRHYVPNDNAEVRKRVNYC
jgi:hypothetical protein